MVLDARNSRQFAVEVGNNLADGLCGASAGWDDVVVDSTSTTPVLRGGAIDGLLGCSGGVDGAHETLNDAEVVIDDLRKRSETVGSARGIGDDCVLGIVGIKVDATHEHGGICGGRRDNDLLGTTLEVSRSSTNDLSTFEVARQFCLLFSGGEDTLSKTWRQYQVFRWGVRHTVDSTM